MRVQIFTEDLSKKKKKSVWITACSSEMALFCTFNLGCAPVLRLAVGCYMSTWLSFFILQNDLVNIVKKYYFNLDCQIYIDFLY